MGPDNLNPGESGGVNGEDQFRLMVASVQDYAIFMLDTEGRVATWNVGAERIKGYQPGEIIGRHFACFYPPEELARRAPWRGLEIAAADGRFEDEGWRLRKDGSRFWANVIITALHGESGELRGFVKVTRDLTDRHNAEQNRLLLAAERQARHESDQQFRFMVANVQDYAIFMLDPDGNVATWNLGARRIKGYEAAEIIGRHCSCFYPLEDIASRKPWRALDVATVEGRYEDEGWRVRKDGSWFWANVVITALRDESGILRGFAKVTRDLSERRRAQEERSQLEAEQIARVEAESANRRLAFVAAASEALSAALDDELTLTEVAQLAVASVADWCTVVVTDEQGFVQRLAVSHSDPERTERVRELHVMSLGLANAPCGVLRVLRSGEPEFVPDITDAFLAAGAAEQEYLRRLEAVGICSAITVPLIARGKVVGAFQIVCGDSGRRYDRPDVTMAQEVARRIALAVDASRLYRSARSAYSRLDESHAVLQGFINSVSSGFAFLDTELRFARVNEYLAALTNLPPTDHVGRTIAEVVPRLADIVEPACRQVLESAESRVSLEVSGAPQSDPLAPLRHLLLNISAVRLGDGRTIGVGVVVTDITDRKCMEDELRESEAVLVDQQRILEDIAGRPLADVTHSVVQFLEHWSSHSHCAVHVLDASGSSLRCVAAPSLPAPCLRAIQKLPVRAGNSASQMAAHAKRPVGMTIQADDQDRHADHPLSGSWAVPVLGRRSELLGTLTLYTGDRDGPTARDQKLAFISARMLALAIERNKAEEARNLKLQTLVEHMAEGLLAVDDEGRILLANPTAHRLLQLGSPVVGLMLSEASLPPQLTEGLNCASHPDCEGTLELILEQGHRAIQAHLSPVATDLGRYGSLTILRDVTLDLQLRRLQNSFVAGVSHELRGPLASVSAVVEALKDGLIPEANKERYCTAIVNEIGRLRRLTDQLLELSKLDAGVISLTPAEFDLADLCAVVQELWNHHCVKAGLELRVNCPSIRLTADYDAVEQILVSLLENAVRFTPTGGTIEIAAHAHGGQVIIAVADTGAGIPAEHQPYVWEPFYKVDQARTLRPENGTGLGLSITRRLVEQLDGEIRLDSELGRGTVFRIRLPLLPVRVEQRVEPVA